mmetsp:Transcript_24213/g.26879  ORF Transcript_24213/g.26879 Transcript_24213/m.26879 type:complete len:97 (+) Transcript_24213:1536-1826(+)
MGGHQHSHKHKHKGGHKSFLGNIEHGISSTASAAAHGIGSAVNSVEGGAKHALDYGIDELSKAEDALLPSPTHFMEATIPLAVMALAVGVVVLKVL